jgi:hypothetical protein
VRIAVGDIVLLDGVQRLPTAKARGKTLIVEIVGRLDNKDAQHLYRANRIHKNVYAAHDDTVDEVFDYEEEEQDVDVDAI